jgi:hypothetical protein
MPSISARSVLCLDADTSGTDALQLRQVDCTKGSASIPVSFESTASRTVTSHSRF